MQLTEQQALDALREYIKIDITVNESGRLLKTLWKEIPTKLPEGGDIEKEKQLRAQLLPAFQQLNELEQQRDKTRLALTKKMQEQSGLGIVWFIALAIIVVATGILLWITKATGLMDLLAALAGVDHQPEVEKIRLETIRAAKFTPEQALEYFLKAPSIGRPNKFPWITLLLVGGGIYAASKWAPRREKT